MHITGSSGHPTPEKLNIHDPPVSATNRNPARPKCLQRVAQQRKRKPVWPTGARVPAMGERLRKLQF